MEEDRVGVRGLSGHTARFTVTIDLNKEQVRELAQRILEGLFEASSNYSGHPETMLQEIVDAFGLFGKKGRPEAKQGPEPAAAPTPDLPQDPVPEPDVVEGPPEPATEPEPDRSDPIRVLSAEERWQARHAVTEKRLEALRSGVPLCPENRRKELLAGPGRIRHKVVELLRPYSQYGEIPDEVKFGLEGLYQEWKALSTVSLVTLWASYADGKRKEHSGNKRVVAGKQVERGSVYVRYVDSLQLLLVRLLGDSAADPCWPHKVFIERRVKEWILYSMIQLEFDRCFWPELDAAHYPNIWIPTAPLAQLVRSRFQPVSHDYEVNKQAQDPFRTSGTSLDHYGHVGAEALRHSYMALCVMQPDANTLLQDWFRTKLIDPDDPLSWRMGPEPHPAREARAVRMFGTRPEPVTGMALTGSKAPGGFDIVYYQTHSEYTPSVLLESLKDRCMGRILGRIPQGLCRFMAGVFRINGRIDEANGLEQGIVPDIDHIDVLVLLARSLLRYRGSSDFYSVDPKLCESDPGGQLIRLSDIVADLIIRSRAQFYLRLPWHCPWSWRGKPQHREFLVRSIHSLLLGSIEQL